MSKTVKVTLTPKKETVIKADDMTSFLHALYFQALINNPDFKVEAKFGDIVVSMYIDQSG